MILFKDILSESIKPDAITLYRGDTKKVEKFLLQKTKSNGLLGTGMYLTDNENIAFQYSARKENGLLFSGVVPHGERKQSTMLDAIKLYASAKGGDTKETVSKMLNNENDYEIKKVGSGAWEDFWIIVDKKLYSGYVSKFEIPKNIVSKCYDAEKPMDENLKKFMLGLRDMDIKIKRVEEALDRSKSLVIFMYEYSYFMQSSRAVWKKIREYFMMQGYVGMSFQGDNYLNDGISDKHRVYLFWNMAQMNKYRVS